MDNPLSLYWSLVHRRAAQEMSRVRWGSEMEAQSGGSSAQFRLSAPPEYASRVLAESPVNFIERFPDETAELRELHGLPGEAAAVIDASWNPLDWVSDLHSNYMIPISFIVLALVLIGGGLVLMGLQTDAGSAAAKAALKVV